MTTHTAKPKASLAQKLRIFKSKKPYFVILSIVLSLVLMVLTASVAYLYMSYPTATADEIIFVLSTPLGKINSTFLEPIFKYFVPTLVVLQVISYIIIKKKSLATSLVVNAIIAIVALGFATFKYKFYETYLFSFATSDFIKEHYVDPKDVTITAPVHKKNFIHIYLESMETSFAAIPLGGGKNNPIIQKLSKFALDNECFSDDSGIINGAHALSGATWTMGSIFAHETGLPLKIPMNTANRKDTDRFFYQKVKALPDILKDNGYKSYVVCGGDTKFSGVNYYYQDHGDYQIYDYNHYKEIGVLPSDYIVWWGYEDRKVYEYAKKELLKIAKNSEPFNFQLVTLDTHFEDGYLCPDCPHDFDDQYANVYRCADNKIDDFIKWCQQQDFYKDTVIVITGDHPTMDKDFCDDLEPNYDRRNFVTIINADKEKEIKTYRNYSSFDMFPTMLSALGFKIEGDKLGLGVNLYGHEKTLLETFNKDEINTELAKKSTFMDKLGQIIDVVALENNYKNINDLFKGLIKVNHERNLITVICQSENSTGVFNEETIELAQKLGLTDLVTKVKNKDDFGSYMAYITHSKTKDRYLNCATIFSDKVDGHKIQGIALNYNLVGQIMGTMLIDNAYFTNLSPGVNVLILNLNTGMVESSYTFHDGKVVKCY